MGSGNRKWFDRLTIVVGPFDDAQDRLCTGQAGEVFLVNVFVLTRDNGYNIK